MSMEPTSGLDQPTLAMMLDALREFVEAALPVKRQLELDHVAPRNPVRRVGGMPVDECEMALDQARRGGAAEVRRMLGEEPVKPGCGGGGRQAAVFGRIR